MKVQAKPKESPSVLSRYQKVLGVLVKYGFEDLASHPPLNRLMPKGKWIVPFRDGKPVYEYTRYERVRLAFEELGTTFIKFAQIAANRPDLLPEELIAELESFHDHVPPVPEPEIRAVLESEFDRPLDEIFEWIDYRPVAAASMAQVHRARLLGGQKVALKIQRPGIAETIESDIVLLRQLAGVIDQYFPQFQAYQPMELVKMFEKSIRKELRFTIEAANLERFRSNFKGNPNIYVPRYFPEASTERVLCLEFIEGYKINDLEQLALIGMGGPELAIKGIDLYFEQVFSHGFFHADPHPGNIFILPDKRVCFIDYGMMGSVVDSDKEMLADLLLAVSARDVEWLKRALMRFAEEGRIENAKNLEYDIIDFFSSYSDLSLDQIDGQEVMNSLNSLFFDYKIRIPGNLLLLLKALVIIEGVGLSLDPKYNIIKQIEPFVRRLMEKKYAPRKVFSRAYRAFGELSNLITHLPEDFSDVMQKIREGKLHIEFEHKGLEGLLAKLETVSNRISFALLLSALILGSSIMALAEMPPYVYGIPLPGFIGFVIASLLTLRLLYSISKHGKF